MTTFLSYLISDNWKYPKASTLPQLKYSTFACVKLHFPRLHHSVTLWLFLDFSRLLEIFWSSSKQTLFRSKPTGSCWTLLKPFYWNKCWLFVVKFKLWDRYISLWLNKYIFQWKGVVLISYTDLCFHYTFHTGSFFYLEECVIKLFSIMNFA